MKLSSSFWSFMCENMCMCLHFSYSSLIFHILWLELTSHLCVAFGHGTYFCEIGLGMLPVIHSMASLNLYVCFSLADYKFLPVRNCVWVIYFAPIASIHSAYSIFLANVDKKWCLGDCVVLWALTACDMIILLSSP